MVNKALRDQFAVIKKQIGVFEDESSSPEGKGFKLQGHQTNPDAPLSPFYLNYRKLQSNYDAKMMGVSLFEQMLEELPAMPDLLIAIPEAIVPVVSSLSDRLRIPMVTPRKDKGYGSGARIDGIWKRGQVGVAFDDVITTAKSKVENVGICSSEGIIVEHVIIYTDRQQGGREQLEEAGLNLHAAYLLNELLEFYLEHRHITEQMYHKINAYRKAA